LRYIIYGAGGVGSVVGGFLHLAGKEVVLVARPAHVKAIKESGLSLISPRGRFKLDIPAVTGAEDLGPFREDDMVLLTAKSQHTHICLGELKAAGAPEDLAVCCMQNSIWNEPNASRVFSRIYGAMIVIPAYYIDPGEVIHNFSGDSGYIDIGCYPEGTDKKCGKLAGDLIKAGFVARTHDKVMISKAGKCLVNLGNAYSIINSTTKEKEGFLEVIRDEAMKVWKGAGIGFETREEFLKRIKKHADWKTWEAPEQKGIKSGGSGWQTLARKAGSSETPRLNGDVADLGRELGINTPANKALTQISVEGTLKGMGPESVPFQELEKLYKKYQE
jgi:2-dehydropantoate 2-reductase